MLKGREIQEEQERQTLAPCAQKSADSAGRRHREPAHPFRTEYQRDRARIIHSRAFRRLEYKTQVFLNGTGDHLRTRLTHTIEVASISRSVARSLGLNEDLAEAIALAHDLGHAPFGHPGEETLDELMRPHGGFEHNRQSLRVVEKIEQKYPRFDGLNLSHEVLEGLRKHDRFHEAPGDGAARPSPSLEAQLANLADEITYYSHDLDDGLEAGFIRPEQLEDLEVWQTTADAVRHHFPDLQGPRFRSYTIRCLIDRQVEDLLQTSSAAIDAAGVRSAEDVRRHPEALVRYSPELLRGNRELRRFLYANLYYHPDVAGMNQRACGWLRDVFEAYRREPAHLGQRTSARIAGEGFERTVADYLSGMTDRYVMEEHRRIFGRPPPPE